MVKADHDQEVMDSKPSTIYWMDVRDNAKAITLKKTKNKGSPVGHTKKNILKVYKLCYKSCVI